VTTVRRRLMGNSLALMANQITQNATSLLLSMAIARTLGPYTLGQYTLAFTFYFIFMTISSQGLKSLLTRELARHPEKAETCLVSGSLLQFGFSLLAYAILVVLVLVLPYRGATRIICWIVGAALIPYGISNITEAIFQSREKIQIIAISTVPIYILRLVVMYLLLRNGESINLVGITLVLSEVVILLIEWGFAIRLLKRVPLRVDWSFMRELATNARTFLAIESVSVVKSRMQVLLLSLIAGETIVGLYGAATQLIQPFYLITQSLIVSSMPTMVRSASDDDPRLKRLVEKMIALLFSVAVPMLVVFWFVGGGLLVFLYRNARFNDAGLALGIAGLSMLPIAFVRVLGYLLMSRGMERVNLRVLIVNTVGGFFLTIVLVSQFGIVGAAVAAVCIELSGAVQFGLVVRQRFFSPDLWKIVQAPLLAGLAMSVVFVALTALALPMLPLLAIAGVAYGVIVVAAAVRLLEMNLPLDRLKALRRR
jgi:O-antigen/teichoic acid export membrane protein